MYKIKDKTKEMASLTLGMDYDSFVALDFEEEKAYIERVNGKACAFVPETDQRIVGRGNPLLARHEYLTMEEVNKGLDGESDNG